MIHGEYFDAKRKFLLRKYNNVKDERTILSPISEIRLCQTKKKITSSKSVTLHGSPATSTTTSSFSNMVNPVPFIW